ncbi:MAG: leucine-rich repeat protein, partial [Oscillospiraceae bacterium]|nr:leucine-rich repeat protein [Oscillospiraceae bacterium]
MYSDFYGCTALESVVIPDSVKSVASNCFTETKLRDSQAGSMVYADAWLLGYDGDDDAELVIKDGTIGIADYAFGWNVHDGGMWDWLEQEGITEWGPKSVVLPDSLKYIGTGAFAGCFSLECINLPESLEVIGRDAFSSCEKLSGSLIIPDGVTEIVDVFSGCVNLESVVIPEGVKRIGYYTFCGCTNLLNVYVDVDNENYTSKDGVLFNKNKSELICYPGGKDGAYEIPEGVTEINWSAFQGCIGLTSITIPESVISLSGSLFSGCTNLTSIQIDSNHESYASEDGVLFNKEKSILLYCPGGKEGNYRIPKSVTEISEGAFDRCTNLRTISIPESVIMIGTYSFNECTSLTDVYYAGTETQWDAIEIEYGNEALTTVTIHLNVTTDPTVIYGDVDENGELNIMDVILLNRNLMIGAKVSAQGLLNADVDGNGTADAVDSLNILKAVVKLITLPVA